MSNIDDVMKAKALLASALSTALNSMSGSSDLAEARGHIRAALGKLDSAAKTQIRRKQNSQQTNENTAKVARAATSQHAAFADENSLARLDAMIIEQQRTIEDLEKKIRNDNPDSPLLRQPVEEEDFLRD